MDAYLAVFAILHGTELVTLDRDFRNFEKDGLKLRLLSECAPKKLAAWLQEFPFSFPRL